MDHQTIPEAAALGDDEALEILVRTYHDRIYRFGLRVCHNPFDADDAVQEAFITLSRRPDVVRDPGTLSWLMTVVRNASSGCCGPFGVGAPSSQRAWRGVVRSRPPSSIQRRRSSGGGSFISSTEPSQRSIRLSARS